MDWTTIITAIIAAAGAAVVPTITMRQKLAEQKRQFESEQAQARAKADLESIQREEARRDRMEAELSSLRGEMREEIRELRARLGEANTEILDLRRRLSDCESKHTSQINEAAMLRAELAVVKARAGIEDRRTTP